MIRVVGSTGADGKTITWYFIVSYTGASHRVSPTPLTKRGAGTFFYEMIQRDKKSHYAEEAYQLKIQRRKQHEHFD